MRRLVDPEYLAFPFRVEEESVRVSHRRAHVREQIEQVLFTDPRERVFRPDFGAGARALVFEPQGSPLRDLARQRLTTALADALQGEVDPGTLDVVVQEREDVAELVIEVSYELATLNRRERFTVTLGGGGASGSPVGPAASDG